MAAVTEVEWRRLRADELRERARAGAMVIVPVGAIEQHGPHLPVEVDSTVGETLALRTARRVAEKAPVVVLPMLWTGISEHHMSFGGTITLDFPEFFGVIRGICRSVVRHGFGRIVLFNAHGGNDNALRVAADELSPELGVPIVQFTYWHAAAEAIGAILERQANLQHACEAETSMMMALKPDLVAADRIAAAMVNATPSLSAIAPGMYRYRSMGARQAMGVVGDPSAASPEKGERLIAAIVDTIAARLVDPELWSLPWTSETIAP